MTTPAHTPTPWKVSMRLLPDNILEVGIDDQHGMPVIPRIGIDEDDAAFIVRAVNAHEELVQAGRDVVAALQMRFMRSGASASEEKAFKALRAAIAKAEAKP